MPAPKAAVVGWRRDHFHRRSNEEAGRTCTGRPSRVAIEVASQRRGAGITPRRIGVQAMHADGFEMARQSFTQAGWRERLLRQHQVNGFQGCRTAKWRSAREHLVSRTPNA